MMDGGGLGGHIGRDEVISFCQKEEDGERSDEMRSNAGDLMDVNSLGKYNQINQMVTQGYREYSSETDKSFIQISFRETISRTYR